MTKEKWYRLVYDVLRPIGALLYPQKFYGLENIPEGPAILCAPHSNVADPILISFALGRKTYVHHLAKAESKTMFIFGWLMKKAGSIFVKRGERDIEFLQAVHARTQGGGEAHRVPGGDARARRCRRRTEIRRDPYGCAYACTDRTGIYPARQKDLSRGADRDRRAVLSGAGRPHRDYDRLARELMERIWALKPEE